VEFSLVVMTFFILSFALMDFSWLLFNQMNMQDAVREAARYASTGDHSGSLSRNASIIQILNQAATKTSSGSSIQSIVISNSSGAVGPDGKTENAGNPGDTVTVTVTSGVPLLTTALSSFVGTSNTFNFTVSSTFKNEPFPASQTN
jgi:Flp pilus assembly protein TadG